MVLKTAPLSQRKYDYVFITVFVLFLVIAWTIDIINALAPSGGLRKNAQGQLEIVMGVSKEWAKAAAWPPQQVFEAFYWWCDTADLALLVNPGWMKFLAVLSPFVYSPFYIYAIWAFVVGNNSVRIPGIMFSTAMFVGLTTIFYESFYGDYPTPNKMIFAAAYGSYMVFPLVLGYRLRNEVTFAPAAAVKSKSK